MTEVDCCDGCTLRRVGCHATCPEYSRKSKKRREELDAAIQERETYRAAGDIQWNGYMKATKNRRKK